MADIKEADDKELQQLLKANMPYFSIQPSTGKVECKLNGHCCPPRVDALQAFINGAKFQKLRTRHEAENVLAKYEPFIIKSKNFPNKLYCTLTVQLLDQSIDAIKLHMSGQKFKRARDRFLEDKQELKEEPNIPGPGDFPEDEDMADVADADSDGAADDDGDAEDAAGGASDGRPKKSGSKAGRSKGSSNGATDAMDEDDQEEAAGGDREDEDEASESDEDEIVFEDVFDEPAPPLRLRQLAKAGHANGSDTNGAAHSRADNAAAAGPSGKATGSSKQAAAVLESQGGASTSAAAAAAAGTKKSKKGSQTASLQVKEAVSGSEQPPLVVVKGASKLSKAERQAAADAAEEAALAAAQRQQQRTKAPKKQNPNRPSSNKRQRS